MVPTLLKLLVPNDVSYCGEVEADDPNVVRRLRDREIFDEFVSGFAYEVFFAQSPSERDNSAEFCFPGSVPTEDSENLFVRREVSEDFALLRVRLEKLYVVVLAAFLLQNIENRECLVFW